MKKRVHSIFGQLARHRRCIEFYGLILITMLFALKAHTTSLIDVNRLTLAQLRHIYTFSSTPDGSAVHQLVPLYTHQSPNHLYHIHLQQYYHHTPIFGGVSIIHTSHPFNQLLAHPETPFKITGKAYHISAEQLSAPPPHFHAQARLILNKFKAAYVASSIQKETILPIIYIDKQQHAHWAYKITLFIQAPNEPPSELITLIDAINQKPFLSWNNLKTIAPEVLGIGYGGNQNTGMYLYGNDYPALTMRRNEELKRCSLENKEAKIVNMNQHYTRHTQAMTFPCPLSTQASPEQYWTGRFGNGFDKINGAFSPSNDALFFASIIKKLYQNWYHIEPIYTSSGNPKRLIMRVHFGEKYTNAFWDGETMTFGDGDDTGFYPFVSLSIVAHEISHGFTQQHANLEYVGQSGAINEAFSDMASMAAENFVNLKADWRLGHEIIKPQNTRSSLRYMDHPSQDGKSFETLAAYIEAEKLAEIDEQSINVHYGSGVFNRLFYLLATSPGWSVRKAFDIMVYANMDYWTPYSDFQEAGCGVMYAAHDLGYELNSLQKALEQIGISWQTCRVDLSPT